MATFVNQTKNSATFTNVSKNSLPSRTVGSYTFEEVGDKTFTDEFSIGYTVGDQTFDTSLAGQLWVAQTKN